MLRVISGVGALLQARSQLAVTMVLSGGYIVKCQV